MSTIDGNMLFALHTDCSKVAVSACVGVDLVSTTKSAGGGKGGGKRDGMVETCLCDDNSKVELAPAVISGCT